MANNMSYSESAWSSVKATCIDAVLAKGIHHDLHHNFDSYIDELLRVFMNNFTVEHMHSSVDTELCHHFSCKNLYFVTPKTPYGTMDTPMTAILRDNYEAIAYGDLIYSVTDGDEELYRAVIHDYEFFTLPVPMNSKLCNSQRTLAYGTERLISPNFNLPTFAVHRTLKIAPMEETFIMNVPLCFGMDKVEIRCEFQTEARAYRTNSTLTFVCKPKSVKSGAIKFTEFAYLMAVPYENPKKYIPIEVLVHILGDVKEFRETVRVIATPKTQMQHFALNMCLDCLFQDPNLTADSALNQFTGKLSRSSRQLTQASKLSYGNYTIQEEIFPNARTNQHKFMCLALCVARLICNSTPYSKYTSVTTDLDCKESYVLKRIETVGFRLCVLLRKYTKHLNRRCHIQLKKLLNTVRILTKPELLKRVVSNKVIKLTVSVRNGVWDFRSNTTDFNRNKTQILGTGFSSDGIVVESHKIVKSFLKKNSNIKPLLTHPSQFGRICMYLTPESMRCAVTRFKAVGGYVTPCIDKALYSAYVFRLCGDGECISQTYQSDSILVLDSTGAFIGWTTSVKTLYERLISYRRQGIISRFVNLSCNAYYAQLQLDAGRIQRPLLIASALVACKAYIDSEKRAGRTLQLTELCRRGFIEFLDAGEEYSGFVLVATSYAEFLRSPAVYTHVEIAGELSMCLTVSRAFANHNQGPRRMYTGNLEKRAISLKTFEDFGNISSYSLWYGQLPLMSEHLDRVFQLRLNEPTACNVHIAIMSLANNIEDSWVFKKEALDRGLLMSSDIITLTHSVTGRELFRKPSMNHHNRSKQWKYASIQDNGLPVVGQVITYGMAVIGKVTSDRGVDGSILKKCTTKFLDRRGSYTVRRIVTYPPGASGSDLQLVRVTLEGSHQPEVGDKFFLAHGQKGTIGRVIPSADLPFIDSGPNRGMIPDVIINVCSLMRVTMGLLLEMLAGKIRALKPSAIEQYETLFVQSHTMKERLATWQRLLAQLGLNSSGKDYFRCGRTGQYLPSPLYNGFVSLRALKQLSKDKLRARDKGPIIELTRQTTVGKRANGGLRFGEMESWSAVSFGAPYLNKAICFDAADGFETRICESCGVIRGMNSVQCPSCKANDTLHTVSLPYTTCLVQQELASMGINIKFELDN